MIVAGALMGAELPQAGNKAPLHGEHESASFVHAGGAMKARGRIYVDADACPVVVREILFRAADRTGVQLTLVANQPLNTPASKNITTLQVPRGFDVADDEIVKRLSAGDLVITSDIPLAAEVIEKGGHALSPRGEMHTTENIGAKLNMRDFMDTMRSSGVEMGGGPSAYGQRDKQEFANTLDRFLAKKAGQG